MADRNHTPESRSSQKNHPTVLSHPVRRRGDFYSLNDLHEAAGGDPGCHPERFLESPLGRAWVDDTDSGRARSALLREGGSVSIFARREVVQAYSLWVGEGFALVVLRAFGARPRSAVSDEQPASRYDLGYVRDLRWDEDRAGDIAWWEFDGQGELSAEEAAGLGLDFFEQTRRLALINPRDAEMALKYSLLAWFDGGFRGADFHHCEMAFCEGLSRAAVAWMAASGSEGVPVVD